MTAMPFPLRRTREGEATHQDRKFRRRARRMYGRTITTRHPDVCEECGQEVPVGSNAFWARGAGMAHLECAERVYQEHLAVPVAGRTDEQRDADYHAWREGGSGSYADHIAGAAEDALLREEMGQ